MAIPKELLALYKGLSKKEIVYIKARWLVSPIDALERAIPLKGKVCDIGCGVGLLSNIAALRSIDREVTGMDLSGEKIAIARKSIGNRQNITFEKSDALKAALVRPDAVTICDTLHHISLEGQERLLKYVYQSLGVGGILLVQDIDKRPFHKYMFARGVDMLLNGKEPVYYRRSREWAGLLEKIGFRVEVVRLDRGYPIAAVLFKCMKMEN